MALLKFTEIFPFLFLLELKGYVQPIANFFTHRDDFFYNYAKEDIHLDTYYQY